MGLATAWVVRVHVPLGARSRLRPLAELRAVIKVVREHPTAGTLGHYRDVMHFTPSLETFDSVRVPAVTVTTYLERATRGEVDDLARAVAAVHPWQHPVIECTGPDGPYLWSPKIEPSGLRPRTFCGYRMFRGGQ